MYQENQLLIRSYFFEEEIGYGGDYFYLATNGTHVRWPDGGLIYSLKDQQPHIKIYFEEMIDRELRSRLFTLTDNSLVERIGVYLAEHYNSKVTNCSSFAHFLLTGECLDCNPAHNNIVITHSMRLYSSKDKIRIGDMICILYGTDRSLTSRKMDPSVRKLYIKTKIKRRRDRCFNRMKPVSDTPVLMPEQIKELAMNPCIDDYHFMVCIGKKHNGDPIWISQLGYHLPGEESISLVVTTGKFDPYVHSTPMIVLTKRGRPARK